MNEERVFELYKALLAASVAGGGEFSLMTILTLLDDVFEAALNALAYYEEACGEIP